MKPDMNANLQKVREQIAQKSDRQLELVANAESANRSLTPEERSEYDACAADVASLQERRNDIEKVLAVGNYSPRQRDPIGMSQREVDDYSIVRLISAMARDAGPQERNAAKLELEASAAYAQQAGMVPRGALVPPEVWASHLSRRARRALVRGERRDLLAGTGNLGGYLIGEDFRADALIELLRNQSAVIGAGATTIADAVGDVVLPKLTGAATGYWISTEGGAPTESQQAIGQVVMRPKTCAAFTDVSRQLRLQSSVDVEGLVRDDLIRVIGLLIDLAALYGSGVGGQPLGLKNHTGLNDPTNFAGASPTWAETLAMIAAVAADNAMYPGQAFITDPTTAFAMAGTSVDTGSGQFVWNMQSNTVAGYPARFSNQITTGDVWFGAWPTLLVAQWGGLDIMVDPYSLSTQGTLRVIAFSSVDIAPRHAQAFCYNT